MFASVEDADAVVGGSWGGFAEGGIGFVDIEM